MISQLSPSLVEPLGWTLVHFLWQGMLIALALAGVLRLLRRHSANTRYLAGCFAMALMLIVPALTFQQVARHANQAFGKEVNDAAARQHSPDDDASTQSKFALRILTSPKHIGNYRENLQKLFPWLVLGWAIGVTALSLRLLGGWLQIQRLRRTALNVVEPFWREKLSQLAGRLGLARTVALMVSAFVEVPTVVGWLKPMILIPAGCLAGLSSAQFEAILAHELAHIRRLDYFVNLLQSALETVLFYHPAVWWASQRVREERENCCDDLAVDVCGDRLAYARALAVLEEARAASAPLALAASGPTLLSRIRRLTGQSAKPERPCWLGGMAALILIFALAIRLPVNRAEADESANATTNALSIPVATNGSNHLKIRTTDRHNGRTAILAKMNSITIDELQFDHAPLTRVIKKLTELIKRNDPESTGINFFIESPPEFASDWADKVTVTINPPGRDDQHRKLVDALDAVVKNANHPIRYDVLDYAIVFTMKYPYYDLFLETRTFQMGTNFFKELLPSTSNNNDPQQVLRQFFAEAGVDLSTNNPANVGRMFVWNNRKGLLLVRATTNELDKLDSFIKARIRDKTRDP